MLITNYLSDQQLVRIGDNVAQHGFVSGPSDENLLAKVFPTVIFKAYFIVLKVQLLLSGLIWSLEWVLAKVLDLILILGFGLNFVLLLF